MLAIGTGANTTNARIDPTKGTPAVMASSPVAELCGLRVPLQGRGLFGVLCTGAIVSAVGFAALQEGVWQVKGYKYSEWMTLWTAITMAVCGQLERMLTGDTTRKGSLVQYLKLSVLTLSGMYFTNASLKYLNYPTRVIFKSSKLLPTMTVGTLMLGRRYSFLEYLAAAGLVAGIVLFTLGDAELLPSFEPAGIALILAGVAADAATSNYEEAAFFRVSSPASQAEVVTFASLFGSGWALMISLAGSLVGKDELSPAMEHSLVHTEVLPLLIFSAACGYVSVSFVLLLIKLYGATITEMVKSMRKVLTVIMSFLLYPKPVSWKYGLGGLAVVASLAITQEMQRRKGGDVTHASHEATSNEPEGRPLTEACADADTEACADADTEAAAGTLGKAES